MSYSVSSYDPDRDYSWFAIARRIAVFTILFAAALGSIHFLWFFFTPRAYFYRYDDVTSQGAIFTDGDGIKYVVADSERWVRSGRQFSFTDDLWCRLGDRYVQVQSQYFNRTYIEGTGKNSIVASWLYPGATVIPAPTECYFETFVSLHLPFGITKNQTIRGTPFEIPFPIRTEKR